MAKVKLHISVSLDGFVAGPNQSEENPLGEGGMRLLNLTLVPILLGSGARLFDEGAGAGAALEIARVVDAPGATHLQYRRGRA